MNERLNKTETKILRFMKNGRSTISTISAELGISVSWSYKCVIHLSELGFLDVEKSGKSVYVQIKTSKLGECLFVLLIEEPALSLDAFIGGSALKVLPLFLPPGHTIREIVERTYVSTRTVQVLVRKWRSMGLLKRTANGYRINIEQEHRIDLLEAYNEYRNSSFVRKRHPEATIVWSDRDEFLISTTIDIDDPDFVPAATIVIAEKGYDIIYRNRYYYHSPLGGEISEAEALVQTAKTDPYNPRPIRYIREALSKKAVTKKEICIYAKKYDIEKIMERL